MQSLRGQKPTSTISTSPLNCGYSGKCGGCPTALGPFTPSAKLDAVLKAYAGAETVFAPRERVRDRVDLIWEDGRLGLYGLSAREVVDLSSCPMMSERLEAWFKKFREKVPPIRKGSVRLRVSPSGERGAWLDFANADVKSLFDEKSYLEWLSAEAFVEIGQRRKHLVWKEGQPKLVDPELRPWFETYDAEMNAIPLFGPVGGFSQTGFAANRALVSAVCGMVKESGIQNWLELFAGNGNFALALAARGYTVAAVEMDELALSGLARSLEVSGLQVASQRADVYLQTGKLPPLAGRGLLVDPPRAGLRELFKAISPENSPEAILYVSCFTETFLSDTEKLTALGYRVKNLVGVDQFPFSPHCEWVSLFMKE